MTAQPEAILEDNLVKQLQELGYTKVIIKDEEDLVANLKTQLEKHNSLKKAYCSNYLCNGKKTNILTDFKL